MIQIVEITKAVTNLEAAQEKFNLSYKPNSCRNSSEE